MLPQDARGLGSGGRKITPPIACIYYSCSRSRNHPSNSSTGFFAMFHAAQYCGKAGQYLQFPSRIMSTTVYQHSCAVPTVATETGKKDTRSGICRDGGVGARQLAAQGGGSRLLPHTPLTAQGPSKRHSPVGRVLRLDGSCVGREIPSKNVAAHEISNNHSESPQEFWGEWLANIRHLVSPQSSINQIPQLGGSGFHSLQ